jgi:lipoprotein-releasing system permease protein
MGFPLQLALRYMGSKKRSFISLGTFFAVLGVALGVAGLTTAMSVTGGFHKEFRDKVLGVNAHVLILKRSNSFTEYRELIEQMKSIRGVTGIAPFTINPMMVTKGDRTATGVMLKGVDPAHVRDVLDLPNHITEGSLDGLRLPGAKPPQPRRMKTLTGFSTPDLDDDQDPTDRPDFLENLEAIASADAAKAGKTTTQTDADFEAEARRIAALVGRPTEGETELALPAGAPVGNIVPDGGYQSALPADDVLPADLSQDPCEKGTGALPGIVIGITLSQNLRAKLGDCVQVTSPTIGFAIAGGAIRPPVAKRFRVTGIFRAGFDQYDAKFVYTDIYQAQEFSDSGDSVTGIEMKVKDIDDARAIARHIDGKLAGGMHYTMDWEELNHGLFTALRIQQVVMSLVLALIIIVAAFTVIATLIMVVLDKRREIAVIKAMGATDPAILRAFLYQGGIVGILGALLGLVLGTITCRWLLTHALPLDPKVYFISHLPVDARPVDFMLVGVFAVLVCLVATVWPALHASRLRPAEAFRD